MERNRVEVALRNGEERLKVILENSYDAFISMDAKRLITDWNRQAEKTFGWSKTEALGQKLSFIVPQHLRRQYLRDIEEFFSTNDGHLLKTSKELVARHKNGTEFPIELTIFRVKEDA
ncbi:MAG TPA: PAS domain S-box protein, partial [Candidatus Obscuribacterales bacterium]|nr:PAS domain S-box protein [Candidatus Obscuribacterales bacterium]